MRISDWSSDVCSSDLARQRRVFRYREVDIEYREFRKLHDRRLGEIHRYERIERGRRSVERMGAQIVNVLVAPRHAVTDVLIDPKVGVVVLRIRCRWNRITRTKNLLAGPLSTSKISEKSRERKECVKRVK